MSDISIAAPTVLPNPEGLPLVESAPPDPAIPPTPAGPPAAKGKRPNRLAVGLGIGAVIGGLVGGSAGGAIVAATRDEPTPVAAIDDSAVEVTTPATPTNSIAGLVAAARPSVVAIHDSIPQTDLFGRTVEGQAAGTGFVLSTDGSIVTNNHVIAGATNIEVNLADGSTVPATVVAADPASDLAVLKIARSGLTPLPLGSSDALQVGDQLIAIGNALDLSGEPTVTTGIVSATGRGLTEPNGARLANLIQTDTAINPGNSGGPLLNMRGQVVGINTAIAGQAQNVGFAIAIDPAKALIDQLRLGQVPAHAILGVSTRLGASGSGAEIVELTAGSAADVSGLRVGDTITAVDGAPIATPDDLGAAIASHSPGDAVEITYLRGADTQTLTATLGVRPAVSN
jgi:S1-C subfamily serine protease